MGNKLTVKRILKTTFSIIFPLKGILSSAKLFANSTKNNLKTASHIKNMATELYESTKYTTINNDSFDNAIKRSGQTVEQLIVIFKRKKNINLSALYIFCILSILSIIHSFINLSKYGFLYSSISLISFFCIFFMLSFSNQFRLWQLNERRLSIDEKGGLMDFMRESNWLIKSLKFEKRGI